MPIMANKTQNVACNDIRAHFDHISNPNYLFKKTQQLGHLTCNNMKPPGEKQQASAYLKVEKLELKNATPSQNPSRLLEEL